MKLSKLSRTSPYMPPLELCLRLYAKDRFTTTPDPQLTSILPRPEALTIGQVIGCNSKNARAQVIVISTAEIFSLMTSFALVLQTKFL